MNRGGFVLPGVLMALLVIGVISFAMSLVATLELLAARSSADAVAARADAVGGLSLALAEVVAAAAAGTLPAPDTGPGGASYGPWLHYGIGATAHLETVSAGVGEGGVEGSTVYALGAEAAVGRAVSRARVVFSLEPQLMVWERSQ